MKHISMCMFSFQEAAICTTFAVWMPKKMYRISVNFVRAFTRLRSQCSFCVPNEPSIFLVKHSHTAVLSGIFIADRTRLVLAAVIDEKALEIGESLGQDAVHTASQGRFCVIYRFFY